MTEVVDGSEVEDHQRVGAPRCLPQSLYDTPWPVAITRGVQLQHRTAGRVGGWSGNRSNYYNVFPRVHSSYHGRSSAQCRRPTSPAEWQECFEWSLSPSQGSPSEELIEDNEMRIFLCWTLHEEDLLIPNLLIELLIYGWLISGHPIITGSTC